MGKGQSFQQRVWGKLDIDLQMNEIGPLFYTIWKKITSKWIRDLNIRAKTIKLLEENIGEKFHDIEFGSDFLDMTSKAQATAEK